MIFFFPSIVKALENDRKVFVPVQEGPYTGHAKKKLWIFQEITREIRAEYSFRNCLHKHFLMKQQDISLPFSSVPLKLHVIEDNMSKIQGFISEDPCSIINLSLSQEMDVEVFAPCIQTIYIIYKKKKM